MAFGKKNSVRLDPLAYNILLLGESKIGKEQPVSEPVLTPNGWIKMGDIKVGDCVIGRDGKSHRVENVFPQGMKDVYLVTFNDGTSTRCGYEHLWNVNYYSHCNRIDDVMSIKDILERGILRANGSCKFRIPVCDPCEFGNDDGVTIDPYILGLMLGDGGFTTNVVTFTNAENDIFESIIEYANENNFSVKRRDFENHYQLNICDETCHGNRFKDALRNLGLIGVDSRGKFIPDAYKNGTVDTRAKVLSGLLNTDGKVCGSRITLSTYSKMIADDAAYIARSLGFIVSVLNYDRTNEESTAKYDTEIEYRVSIKVDDFHKEKFDILFLSDKHTKNLSNAIFEKNASYKGIKSIELIGKEESQCIMLADHAENGEELYITNDFIVTHNTTLVKEVCEKLSTDDGYLFLEIGMERGADAIEGINYVNCPEWSYDYDELTNSVGFIDVVDDIVANKNSDYKNLRVVVWDTYDQLITIAERESIRLWNKECREKNAPDKCAKSINAAWGGFGKGEKKAMELMFAAMDELRKVGVATIVIGHVKNKDVSDVVTGETYQVLTSDQQQNYFNALKKNLHFLGLAYIDRTIVKENTGKKNIVTGKDIKANKVRAETRKIKFRDDNYAVDSGSRFANIVPEIEMTASEFIKALTDAIESERSKSGKTVEQSKAEQDAEMAMQEERIEKAETANKTQNELDAVKAEIIAFVANNKTDINKVKPILMKCRELGYANPKEINDMDDAQTVLALTLI